MGKKIKIINRINSKLNSKRAKKVLAIASMIGLFGLSYSTKNTYDAYKEGRPYVESINKKLTNLVLKGKDYLESADNSIVDNVCSEITELTMDAICDDFELISLFPNLKTLYIENIEELSEEAKELVGNSKIDTIKMYVKEEYVNMACDVDLSWIKSDIQVVLDSKPFYRYVAYDFENLVMYRFYSKLKNECACEVVCPKIDKKIDKYIEYDKRIKDIISDYNLAEGENAERVCRTIDYVVNSIEYDPRVSNKGISALFLIPMYNLEPLKSALESEEGVCINYAVLTYVLANYLDLPMRYAQRLTHAWCCYDNDGEELIIDSTFIDNNGALKEFLSDVINCEVNSPRSSTLHNLFIDEDKDSHKEWNDIYLFLLILHVTASVVLIMNLVDFYYVTMFEKKQKSLGLKKEK